jgi:hypothetical protein
MSKLTLKTMLWLHQGVTRNNTPGIVPIPPVVPTLPISSVVRKYHSIPSGARSHFVMQHAINALTKSEMEKCQAIFAPHVLSKSDTSRTEIQPEHFACLMVHPITGKTISSNKKLMNDPAMAETWQTVFGNDFGGMSQGDNKTVQKGTNTMFIMTHNDEIHHILATSQKITYGNPVINY